MEEKNIRIKRALFSCWNKEGLAELAQVLVNNGVTIISSGGTSRYLKEHNIAVTEVDELTGFPEFLDGRVKTLHPAVHGGILARRTSRHLDQLRDHNIEPIDLVVVNLYPFLDKVNEAGKDFMEMVELIDIGGPAMVRAAAKNFENVAVLHQPVQYQEFIDLYRAADGTIPYQNRKKWAADAFFYTAYYDSQISAYLDDNGPVLPQRFSSFFEKKQDLRYGENPHQEAAFYQKFKAGSAGEGGLTQLWGKEMSFNNFVDVSAAAAVAQEFESPFVAIIKHTNPCGAASGKTLPDAFGRALAGDPLSAYGGIVAANRTIDAPTAELIIASFYECLIAPAYSDDALEILKKKKNLRVLVQDPVQHTGGRHLDYKNLEFGTLVQQSDTLTFDPEKIESVGSRAADERELADLYFAWTIVKHVKSNAIVFVKNGQVLGVGAGQMSRVDAVMLAGEKARHAGHDLKGAVMASDAFFPFPDGVEEAVKVGITAVIQPGGSVRDELVINAAREAGIAMLFTKIRHFKH